MFGQLPCSEFRRVMAPLVVLFVLASERGIAGDSLAGPTPDLLARVDRTIVNEPRYEAPPRYCLLALRDDAALRVWMVEDGKRLYLDKNANGDLTDDGPPLEPSDVRDLGDLGAGKRWDFNYRCAWISGADGSRHTDFDLRRWNYGAEKDSYGLSLSVDGKLPMYAGWFGTFWSTSPATAPVIHFGGPLKPHILRRAEFVVGSGTDRLSLSFVNPGRGDGATSRFSIDALPASITPRLTVEWPVAPGTPPLVKSYPLPERCCYWEFYEPIFRVPREAVAGEARLTVSFNGGDFPVALTTPEFTVPVVDKSPPAKE